MSVALIRSPEFVRDMESILQYFIDDHRPATAIKFGEAVTRTLDVLALFPEMGTRWESDDTRMATARFQIVRGFRNYLVFYRLTDLVDLMRIVDGRRDLTNLL